MVFRLVYTIIMKITILYLERLLCFDLMKDIWFRAFLGSRLLLGGNQFFSGERGVCFDLDGDGLGDYFIQSDGDEELLVESPFAIEEGVLFPYVNNPDIYVSPQDPFTRGRSYSFNGYLGKYPDSYVFDRVVTGAANKRRNPAERLSNLPNPECTMAFVVEEQRFTLGAIGVSSSGWGGSEVSFNQKGYIVDPLSRVWIDLPALWNPDGVNIS